MGEWLATMVMALALSGAPDSAQASPNSAQDDAVQVEDVVVVARRRAEQARTFVDRVAAPARGRGLGRWRSICPGIVNLSRPVAQPIADRIATQAAELGIAVEAPGCEANVIVVFTTEAPGLTRLLVESSPRTYRHGGNGIDRGTAALNDFINSDQPVRWWTLSVPIDSRSGKRAVRIPGDRAGGPDPRLARAIGCNPNDCVGSGVPLISSNVSSRLNSQIVDQIYRSIVIVDIEAVAGLSTQQIGDYLAMVTLSQVDPEAEVAGFETILNVFDDREGVAGLTEWDRAYLTSLYGSTSARRDPNAQADDVAGLLYRATLARSGQGEPPQ